ncbi:glycosyltransferase family 4 protein [Carboxydothermus ferrireducens]|uniref:Glycosyltransferase involved in cell wall biosynthesis n=1 Tax=Carboxydothermus ferrireducens DSM 11255 TaxID=1119529 RepID=A0ABX2R710_9THEO|nr:glycosyltransferase family 4 protein [Carboxydothermus ferrireducens]NYE56944.1 glycosyltransferase involved in cell wall biosynthesis [Carboxydothermus ferrireducens DSM 11255]
MKNIAIVHEWLTSVGGSEKVVETLLCTLNIKKIYTLVYHAENFSNSVISKFPIETSFIQKIPFGKKKYRSFLPLMPLAIEQFDLSDYDIIISSSHAVAKGVLTNSHQVHISYIHTPIRYAWDLYFQYLSEGNLEKGVKSIMARLILHYIRLWDYAAAQRVDYFIANSKYVARRIKKTYGREAAVIYPPVEVEKFKVNAKKDNYFLAFSRLVPYKKIDLIVETFNKLNLPLVVIGDGPEMSKIKKIAGKNIDLLGWQPDEVVKDYMEKAKALVFAADEDFGIIPVEAQACGTPVIALGKGGTSETVIDGETGIHFNEQTVESLSDAISRFLKFEDKFDPYLIRKNAERFSKTRFQNEIKNYLNMIIEKHF